MLKNIHQIFENFKFLKIFCLQFIILILKNFNEHLKNKLVLSYEL